MKRKVLPPSLSLVLVDTDHRVVAINETESCHHINFCICPRVVLPCVDGPLTFVDGVTPCRHFFCLSCHIIF